MWALAPNRINSTKSRVRLSILARLKAGRCSLRIPHSRRLERFDCVLENGPVLRCHIWICFTFGSRPRFLAALHVPFSFPCLSIFWYHEKKKGYKYSRSQTLQPCQHIPGSKTKRHTSHQITPVIEIQTLWENMCVYYTILYLYFKDANVPTLIRLKKTNKQKNW